MIILDLFCGAGGACKGIMQADCNSVVVGYDIESKNNYPGTFIQYDVRKLDFEYVQTFDFIWASPPCQGYSYASNKAKIEGKIYPDLIKFTRNLLLESGKPFVIENVYNAPIRKDLVLNGLLFDLKVIRTRSFEVHGFKINQPTLPKPSGTVVNGDYITVAGNGRYKRDIEDWQEAMGIDWITNRKDLAQAVPPAYSKFIFLQYLQSKGGK